VHCFEVIRSLELIITCCACVIRRRQRGGLYAFFLFLTIHRSHLRVTKDSRTLFLYLYIITGLATRAPTEHARRRTCPLFAASSRLSFQTTIHLSPPYELLRLNSWPFRIQYSTSVSRVIFFIRFSLYFDFLTIFLKSKS